MFDAPGSDAAGGALSRRERSVRIGELVGAAYLLLTVAFLFAGQLVMDAVVGSWLGELDSAITRWFARNRSAPLDAVTAVLSNLGDTFTVIGVAVGAGTVLLAGRLWRRAVVLVVGLPLELCVFLSTTFTVSRPRPFVDPLDAVPATASFPSGHMAASVVLYGGLALIATSLDLPVVARRAVWAVAVVIALGVGFSRVYRGLHHPTDVVAGALLGIGCLIAAVAVSRLLPSAANGDGR